MLLKGSALIFLDTFFIPVPNFHRERKKVSPVRQAQNSKKKDDFDLRKTSANYEFANYQRRCTTATFNNYSSGQIDPFWNPAVYPGNI